MRSLSNAVELLNVLQDMGQSLFNFPLRLEYGDITSHYSVPVG